MIANRNRPSSSKLLAAAVAVLLLTGWVLPASVYAAQPAPGQISGMARLLAKAGDKTVPGTAKKGKETEKKAAVPELPALPHFLAKIMPDKAHTIHKWMWVIRPIYALIIVTIAFIFLLGIYRKRAILPTRVQTAMEMIVEGLDNMICGILGKKHGRAYLPYLGALFVYIVCLNWFPTAHRGGVHQAPQLGPATLRQHLRRGRPARLHAHAGHPDLLLLPGERHPAGLPLDAAVPIPGPAAEHHPGAGVHAAFNDLHLGVRRAHGEISPRRKK
jgi:hypothetical protein